MSPEMGPAIQMRLLQMGARPSCRNVGTTNAICEGEKISWTQGRLRV